MPAAPIPPRPGEVFPRDRLVFATPGPENSFFGYYDKSPLDGTGARLLCLRTDCATPLPGEGDTAEVGFWSLQDGAFHALARTRAFNWQQGAMLQWLGPDFSRRIVFNDRRGDRFVAVVLDVESGESRDLPLPVYAVRPDGVSALCVDFERLYFPRRNYAYAGIVRPDKDANLVEGDGIFHLDLATGSHRLLIATAEMLDRSPLGSMDGGDHYLEHLMFSPSGRRFMFLHRWRLADGGIYTRLYTADGEGGDVRCLLDSGKVTHACWRGEDEILCWGAPSSALGRLRGSGPLGAMILKPLLGLYRMCGPGPALSRRVSGASYLLLRDVPDYEPARFAPSHLDVDGHPGWNPVFSQWLLTDTYEDRQGFRQLILYDGNNEQRIDLARLFSPEAFNAPPGNCDLHPRWDFSGRYVCVDSGREDARRMYLFDVSDIVAG